MASVWNLLGIYEWIFKSFSELQCYCFLVQPYHRDDFCSVIYTISAIFLWKLFSEIWWTQSEHIKNDRPFWKGMLMVSSIFHWFQLFHFYTPASRRRGGGELYCFTSVRLSIRLRYFSSHFSHIVGSVFGPIRFLLPVSWLCSFLYTLNIYAHISSQASYRYPILWEAFFDPSDSYFLFADLVGFYTHLTYMHIFRRIFLNKYWWQESDIWSQASYRYAILLEAFLGPIYAHFSLHFSQQILMVEI